LCSSDTKLKIIMPHPYDFKFKKTEHKTVFKKPLTHTPPNPHTNLELLGSQIRTH